MAKEGDSMDEKGAEKASKAPKKPRLKRVEFTSAEYLGGIPNTKPKSGSLYIDAERNGVGFLNPKFGVVEWSQAKGISYESGTVKKSRAGKAIAFGTFALLAKSAQDDTTVTVLLDDGNAAVYQVKGKKGPVVCGKMNEFPVAAGVPCIDEAPVTASGVADNFSLADELSKLASLRDSGVLTEEEFNAQKLRLLG